MAEVLAMQAPSQRRVGQGRQTDPMRRQPGRSKAVRSLSELFPHARRSSDAGDRTCCRRAETSAAASKRGARKVATAAKTNGDGESKPKTSANGAVEKPPATQLLSALLLSTAWSRLRELSVVKPPLLLGQRSI